MIDSHPLTYTLKPAPGRRVLDPATHQPLPERGAEVVAGTYWERRLLEGDVTLVTLVQPAVKATSRTTR
jgi:hypothetical protein